MCGILGYYSNTFSEDIKNLNFKFNEALNLLNHRGPDDRGFETFKIDLANENSGFLALGFNRLSIIDLSFDGHQPMHSKEDRYILVFNGEIYNYVELKNELKVLGHSFNSETDTEVLIVAWAQWGVKSLERLIGMFSFVIFDRVQQNLTLVRDAFGIKPIFYKTDSGKLYFSSEIPALLKLLPSKPDLDYQRCYDYLVNGDYDSNSQTFFESINHLLPAHYCIFHFKTNKLDTPVAWWRPNITNEINLGFDEAAEKLKNLFLENVKMHLRSDVPLGVSLSGGIDSSSIVSAIRYLQPNTKINTFSYIPNDKSISEEKWIDLVSKKLNTISNKITIKNSEIDNYFEDLILKQGEPFGGTSVLAHYCVFKFIKSTGIKVILDGQGADEVLGGYDGYPGYKLLSLLETKGFIAGHKFILRWSFLNNKSYFFAWAKLGQIIFPNFIYKLCHKIFSKISKQKIAKNFLPDFLNLKYLANKRVQFEEKRILLDKKNKGKRVKEALAYALTKKGLHNLLRHADRNSMAFSIESRVPFLSLPLVNFLLSLPENYLVSDEGITKYIFRKAMRGIVDDKILDRKDKIGFLTPESSILLSNKDFIYNALTHLEKLNFFNKEYIIKKLKKFTKNSYDNNIWRLVNFSVWYKKIFQ